MARTKDGMQASAYAEWLDKGGYRVDPFTMKLIENFVIGTPSSGLSAKGRDLYSDYGLTQPKMYKQLWDKLITGIDTDEIRVCDTRKKVKESIIASKVLAFNKIPSILLESVCIWTSSKYQDDAFYKVHFSSLPRNESKGKPKDDVHHESEERWSVVYVNQLFRHIRNSLAHGRFLRLSNEHHDFYILEDEKDDEITARIIITCDRLNYWIDLLNKGTELLNFGAEGGKKDKHREKAERVSA